jgi:OHCU decarboxylase
VSYPIYKNLASLNDLPPGEAEAAFLDCCGSREWARRMAEVRPFPMLEDLFATAEKVWFSLAPADRLEAFAAHPKIGSKKSAPAQDMRAADWSGAEQSGMAAASDDVREQLAEVNRLYEDKFGFIFIVCATGRSADEMAAIARARLGNSLETEMQLASEEQAKITEIRLSKLLEK